MPSGATPVDVAISLFLEPGFRCFMKGSVNPLTATALYMDGIKLKINKLPYKRSNSSRLFFYRYRISAFIYLEIMYKKLQVVGAIILCVCWVFFLGGMLFVEAI